MTTICFDVDGTLITPQGPRYDIIHMLLTLKNLGHQVYVWSGGGQEYAEGWVSQLGLGVPALRKGEIRPDIAVDDGETGLGIVDLKV